MIGARRRRACHGCAAGTQLPPRLGLHCGRSDSYHKRFALAACHAAFAKPECCGLIAPPHRVENIVHGQWTSSSRDAEQQALGSVLTSSKCRRGLRTRAVITSFRARSRARRRELPRRASRFREEAVDRSGVANTVADALPPTLPRVIEQRDGLHVQWREIGPENRTTESDLSDKGRHDLRGARHASYIARAMLNRRVE